MSPYEINCLAQTRPYGDAQAILTSGILPDPWYVVHGANGKQYRLQGNDFSRRSHSNMWFQAHGLILIDNSSGKQITTWTEKAIAYRERILAAELHKLEYQERYKAFPELARTVFPIATKTAWEQDRHMRTMVQYFDFA